MESTLSRMDRILGSFAMRVRNRYIYIYIIYILIYIYITLYNHEYVNLPNWRVLSPGEISLVLSECGHGASWRPGASHGDTRGRWTGRVMVSWSPSETQPDWPSGYMQPGRNHRNPLNKQVGNGEEGHVRSIGVEKQVNGQIDRRPLEVSADKQKQVPE